MAAKGGGSGLPQDIMGHAALGSGHPGTLHFFSTASVPLRVRGLLRDSVVSSCGPGGGVAVGALVVSGRAFFWCWAQKV